MEMELIYIKYIYIFIYLLSNIYKNNLNCDKFLNNISNN